MTREIKNGAVTFKQHLQFTEFMVHYTCTIYYLIIYSKQFIVLLYVARERIHIFIYLFIRVVRQRLRPIIFFFFNYAYTRIR